MILDGTLYAAGHDHLLEGGVTAHASALRVVLVGPGYTYDADHVDSADLGANIVATSDLLTSVAVADGYVTAAKPTWPAGTAGLAVAGYVVWDATHDYLLGYQGRLADGRPIDTTTTTGGVDLRLQDGRLLRLGATG